MMNRHGQPINLSMIASQQVRRPWPTYLATSLLSLSLGCFGTLLPAVAQDQGVDDDLFLELPAEADSTVPAASEVDDFYLPSEAAEPAVIEPIAVDDSYLLGVGDYLKVDIFNIPDYGGEFRVLSGGVLNLPVVGPVTVENLTMQEAATLIEQELQPYVRRPRVTLSLLEARPFRVAIVGEVNRPGAYTISVEDESDETSIEAPTLTGVIEKAGGITQLADIRRIEVQRRQSPLSISRQADFLTSVSEGAATRGNSAQFRTITVNLWDLLKTGSLDTDLPLQDGDRILIPTAADLNAEEIAELASASFSPDQITVNVVGEVNAPGAIQVPPNTPLNQAVLAAGGFNTRANQGVVDLVRLNPNGTASQREVPIDFSQGINEETNPSLRPNDTIVVRRSGLTQVTDTVGTILSPINGVLNIFRLFGL